MIEGIKHVDTLSIIGNAVVETDYSKLIDNSKYVVRFNWLLNYKQNTGCKTNALALAGAKHHIRDYLNPPPFRRDNYQILYNTLKQVETLIFPIPDSNRECFNRLRRIDSFIEHFSVQDKTIKKYFSEDTYLQELKKYGWNKQYVSPSSGYTVIMNILDDVDFKDFNIYLLGFNWNGWQGHPWYNEEMVIRNLSLDRRVTILS